MKKIKFISLLLIATMLLFVGCGELNDNLRVTNFNVGSADLIFRYVEDYSKITGYGLASDAIKSSPESEEMFGGYATNVALTISESMAISVAMDFCDENYDNENGTTFKIYEHYNKRLNEHDLYSKYVINVSRTSRQSRKFKTTLYYVNATRLSDLSAIDYQKITNSLSGDATSANLTLNGGQQQINRIDSYEFTISLEPITNKYTVSYQKGKACSAEYYFDKDRGYMTLNISSYNSQYSDGIITTKLFIGGYKNNIISARTLVSYNSRIVGYQQEYVLEFLDKIFSIKSKLGICKDSSKYADLKSVLETDIAVSNSGDNSGYIIQISTDNILSTSPRVIVSPVYVREEN